ncbi:MAG: hypothetical protein JXB48_23775 [Candidatus Latescibacteria bacterium]|nr:hypothetical protein [Candidatus Latescibacterota bacterium]
MKQILITASFLGLLLTVAPSFMVLKGAIDWNLHAQLMFTGMILWFGTAPFWMNKEKTNIED